MSHRYVSICVVLYSSICRVGPVQPASYDTGFLGWVCTSYAVDLCPILQAMIYLERGRPPPTFMNITRHPSKWFGESQPPSLADLASKTGSVEEPGFPARGSGPVALSHNFSATGRVGASTPTRRSTCTSENKARLVTDGLSLPRSDEVGQVPRCTAE